MITPKQTILLQEVTGLTNITDQNILKTRIATIQKTITSGVNPNFKNQEESTFLHLVVHAAMSNKTPECNALIKSLVDFLINNQADFSVTDAKGLTALDYFDPENNWNIAEFKETRHTQVESRNAENTTMQQRKHKFEQPQNNNAPKVAIQTGRNIKSLTKNFEAVMPAATIEAPKTTISSIKNIKAAFSIPQTATTTTSTTTTQTSKNVQDIRKSFITPTSTISATTTTTSQAPKKEIFVRNVNAKDAEGRTALHNAAFTGDAQLVKDLIKQGADINALDNNNTTPLHSARTLEIAKILKANGANVHAKNIHHHTPLGSILIATHLLNDADPQKKLEYIKLMTFYIEQGANPEISEKNFEITLLGYAKAS
ncbi:MAG TPA: ankyrin repeat domain-containing protein [Rickettsia endosymbiont of Pyrocoelia pectoralis]|nr:ankyrin repeat domain-containing protein [Rickettsia endosymbiont of Pyrocoelia pectoralis]